jgi:hypothetical protein
MPFQKNDPRINRGGRKKGVPNRSTEQMKVTLNRAINMGLDYLKEDYEKLRKEDPKGALTILTKLMDYTLPKLKSVDLELKGEINHKLDKIQIEVVDRKDGVKDKND